MTGLTRSVSLDNLYRECGWLSLSERRKQQKLNFINRSVNGLVPTYITVLIPPIIRETTNYPLRNQNNITIPFCRTELFRKSCIPSGVALWNSLHESLRNSSSLNSFKCQIITKTCLYNFDPLKPHFYIVKLRFTGVYIIFLISAQNIDCGYSLEPSRRGSSNEYPHSMF